MATDQMIALDIIVSFCIFSLLKCDRIFGKNLGHDICGKVKSLTQHFLGVSTRFGSQNLR